MVIVAIIINSSIVLANDNSCPSYSQSEGTSHISLILKNIMWGTVRLHDISTPNHLVRTSFSVQDRSWRAAASKFPSGGNQMGGSRVIHPSGSPQSPF